MRGELIDFGDLKIIDPAKPLTRDQFSAVRAACGLARRSLRVAAHRVLEVAGLVAWPPARHRTTSIWTEAQKRFATANCGQMDSYSLAARLSELGPRRSHRAVDFWLNERGLKAVSISIGRERGERINAPAFTAQDDRAHVAAVMAARESGFGWGRA